MDSNEVVSKARIAVEEILSAINVARVVYVDDANDGDVSIEDVIAAISGLDPKAIPILVPEFGESLPEDPEVLRQKVRDVWAQFDLETKLERSHAILIEARRHDVDDTDDVADASILSDLIPKEKLLSLSPSEWERQKEALLQDNQKQRTLFLFDRDLSDAGGDIEGGIKIISSLLANDEENKLICGLLTHTVTPDTQPQQWIELSKTHNIPKDRFIVIPKLHLSKDPILFAQTLKFVALSPDFSELKRMTKDIIAAAATVAANQVDEVSIYDLDHIVFRVSADEGIWEPDMLFRLHALFHRLESRRLAHEGGNLETVANKLRAVSTIPTNCELFSLPSSTWELQRKELYEFDDHINKNLLPIEVGDIFERVESKSPKRYVLLAQPCDLMVRNDGKRHPEPIRIPLAEVVCTNDIPQYSDELPYFGSKPSEKWYVKFKIIHFVRPQILDLCVLNNEGLASFVIGDNVPSNLRPAWKARYEILSRFINKSVRKIDQLAPKDQDPPAVKQAKEKIVKDYSGVFLNDDLFKGSLINDGEIRKVTYNCRRIARLSRSRAIGLLMAYTASIGRPAYEREFVIT